MSDPIITATDTTDGVTTLALTGALDLYAAPALRRHLLGLTNAGLHRLAIDLGGVDFVDSTGLGVLLKAHKRALSHGGNLYLVVPADHRVAVALRAVGIARTITVCQNTAQAAEMLARSRDAGCSPRDTDRSPQSRDTAAQSTAELVRLLQGAVDAWNITMDGGSSEAEHDAAAAMAGAAENLTERLQSLSDG